MSDRRPALRRAAALVAALMGALALAGCAQEGKLVSTPLPVTAVATSFLPVSTAYLASGPVLNRVINARFKIVVHAQNACEAQHVVLELRRIDNPTPTPPSYIITPIARYNADDKCVSQVFAPVDTTVILDVNGVLFGQTDSTGTKVDAYTFSVASPGPAALTLVLDTLITDTTPGTSQFEVRVEDRLTAALVGGATVAIDQLAAGGVATPLDSALTNSAGIATVTVPAPADTAGAPNLPYRVRVSNGASLHVVSMPSFPARYLRREKIVVRL